MKDTINTYFAVLIVTIIGAGATLIIVHIGTINIFASTFNRNGPEYTELQQSILNSPPGF